MFDRICFTSAAMALSFTAIAAPQWAALSGNNADETFVDRPAYPSTNELVDVDVLRVFDEPVALGNDPVTGVELYPHRSVRLTYKVNCGSGTLAMSQWTMYDGSFGDGNVMWDVAVRDQLAFSTANDQETRAVMRSICGTSTASR